MCTTPLPVTLVTRQPTRVAYLRHTGPYGPSIEQFWQERVYPWMVMNGLLHVPRYGISLDDPNITAPAQCRYDACLEVSAEFEPNGGALISTLPGGRYASMPFKGTSVTIVDAWTSLLRDWLPSSGLQLDTRPMIEAYTERSTFDPATGVFSCDIEIPVMPL